MKRLLRFVFLFLITFTFSQNVIGRRLYNGINPKLIGEYLNTSNLSFMRLNADTTVILTTCVGELTYKVLCYGKHRIRRMTWFTLGYTDNSGNVATLQMYRKKGGEFLVEFLDLHRCENSEVFYAQKLLHTNFNTDPKSIPLESSHQERFITLMDGNMPKWRFFGDELNRLPFSHVEWRY